MAVSVPFVRRLLLCAIGVTALAACGNPSTSTSAAPAPEATTRSDPAATQAVPDSLAFSAPRVGGGKVDLAGFAGQPVLLWFWAPT